MNKQLPCAFAILLSFLAGHAGAEEPGFGILTYPSGARAIAMGEAQAAIADGPDAGFWNPAAVAFAAYERGTTFTYSSFDVGETIDITFMSASHLTRIEALRGAVAGSLSYLSHEVINPERPGSRYTPFEVSPSLFIAGQIDDYLAAGCGLKLVHADYEISNGQLPDGEDHKDTGPAFDFGFLLRDGDARVSAGAAVQNLGPNLPAFFAAGSAPLPRNVKVGFGTRVIEDKDGSLVIAVDLNKRLIGENNGPRLNLGGEAALGWAALRLGWIYDGWRYEEGFADEDRTLSSSTLGFGLRFEGVAFDWVRLDRFELDYARGPWLVGSLLEDTHRLTLSAWF